ncbi:alpha/beta fold hydrolase [Erythrobacter arachoides]|uniref:Alpha/beta fold hydrolase n=1 Tax=Aurantiacibacter arachoides TaxID=1850444 RepID=A0A844ZYT8_9SPHN|nr:alpha/beta fold hydrolase [Aurantiacibacter arachoides]MXO93451.1 alpha/beta fold hydrolase [Aurantiacibacter arachoides]GGD49278.1 alpha/beta hydrolase [Aurantiacibacter arachoides]
MSDLTTSFIDSHDGTRMAVHRMGAGRPVLLLHGLFSSAEMNWIKFGTARRLADAGFEAIMPDWRVHGHSDAPVDGALYTAGVLVRDAFAIVEELELHDYDLVGFSLGARTAASAVTAGLAPRRLVLAGMGLEGLVNWRKRVAFFIDMIDRFDTIEHGDPAFFARSFLKSQGIDRHAARLLLTQGVDEIDAEALATIAMPTMVLIGEDDADNGSPERLAEALPQAKVVTVPGNHMSSVMKPEFGSAIVDYLSGE